jgi:4-carboxymuconolactone decarboxylase
MSETNARRFGDVPPELKTPEYHAAVAAMSSRPPASVNGVRGPTLSFLWSPHLADPLQRVGEELMLKADLASVYVELAILVTARHWTAQFEWYAHRSRAIEAGVPEAAIEAIARGERPEIDDDATAVYDFAVQLLNTGEVTDEVWEGVAGRWGKSGAIELISTVGFYCLIAFVLNVDRYPVPDGHEPLKPLPVVASES